MATTGPVLLNTEISGKKALVVVSFLGYCYDEKKSMRDSRKAPKHSVCDNLLNIGAAVAATSRIVHSIALVLQLSHATSKTIRHGPHDATCSILLF